MIIKSKIESTMMKKSKRIKNCRGKDDRGVGGLKINEKYFSLIKEKKRENVRS
jgi:hypothetical protein